MEGETLQGNFTINIRPDNNFDLHITADHENLKNGLYESVLCPESQIIHYNAPWLLNSVVKFELNFTKQQEASNTSKNAGDCKYNISIEYANSDNPFNYFGGIPESYYLGQINVGILEKNCPFGTEKVSSSCVPCMVGQFSALDYMSAETHATCKKCGIGQYQSEIGKPYCSPCIRKSKFPSPIVFFHLLFISIV